MLLSNRTIVGHFWQWRSEANRIAANDRHRYFALPATEPMPSWELYELLACIHKIDETELKKVLTGETDEAIPNA